MAGKLWKGRKRPKLDSLTPDEEVGLDIEHFQESPICLSILSLAFCVQVYLSELIAAEDGDEECAEQERYIFSSTPSQTRMMSLYLKMHYTI